MIQRLLQKTVIHRCPDATHTFDATNVSLFRAGGGAAPAARIPVRE